MPQPRHPDRERAEDLLRLGHAPVAVAELLALDHRAVARWRRELGLAPPRPVAPASPPPETSATPPVTLAPPALADVPLPPPAAPVEAPAPPSPEPVEAQPEPAREPVPTPPRAIELPVLEAVPEPVAPAWPTESAPVEKRSRPLLPARPASEPPRLGRPPKPKEDTDPQVYGIDLARVEAVPPGAPEWFADFLEALRACGRPQVALRWAGLSPADFEAWGAQGGCTRPLWRAILRARAAYDLRIQQRMEAASAQGKVSAMRWLLEVDGKGAPPVPLSPPGGEQDRGTTALDFVRRMVEQVAASASGTVLERDLNLLGLND